MRNFANPLHVRLPQAKSAIRQGFVLRDVEISSVQKFSASNKSALSVSGTPSLPMGVLL